MSKSDGATKLTPHDDQLAALLAEVGYSNRRIGAFFGRDDKTIAAAVDRAKSGKSVYTVEQKRLAKKLLEFNQWLEEGRGKGFIDALAAVQAV